MRWVVASMFKDERPLLREWVAHYLAEGAEHFFLIDNGSTDAPEEVLAEFGSAVTLVRDPHRQPLGTQTALLNKHLLPRVRGGRAQGVGAVEIVWVQRARGAARRRRRVGLHAAGVARFGALPPHEQVRSVGDNLSELVDRKGKICRLLGRIPAILTKDMLFMNAWDPHSVVGNGNAGDPTLDGFFGSLSDMGYMSIPEINRNLLENVRYV
jgi:hypothetical protein